MIHRATRPWPLTAKVQEAGGVLDIMCSHKVFMTVSRKMISISMIVDKHQYYTVMVLDSQACSPRIITNLYSQARYMATTTHTST